MDQICPKKVFPVKSRKGEHQHWILHLRISLDTKFQLNLTIWFFGPNLPKKGVSSQKGKTWTSSFNSSYSIELVLVPNFSLNWQFWYSGPNFPKRVLRVSMVVTYYIKRFHAGADRQNGILISFLLLLAETIIFNNI